MKINKNLFFSEEQSFGRSIVLKTLFVLLLIGIYFNSEAQTWQETSKIVIEGGLEVGSSVDIYGDYAVIGDCGYSLHKGCAYVFKKETTGWAKIATLTSSDGESNDWFGFSVGIYGDNIVIGAMQNGFGGAAYVYTKPQNGWVNSTETAKLSGLNITNYSKFGWSVDIFENTIVVGSTYNNSVGSAFVYLKPESGWVSTTETAKLSASDGLTNDNFGISASIYGNTIVIGACNYTGKGAAYIFEKPEGGWINTTETAILKSSDIEITDFFGSEVSIFMNTVIIGASSSNKKGAAYIFEKPESGWVSMTQTAKLTATDVADFDSFGNSVAISDNKAIVSAYRNNGNGAAYVFEKPESGWVDMTQDAKLTASDAPENSHFGISVSVSEKYVMVGDNMMNTVYVYTKEISNYNADHTFSDINFYPNPTSDYLTINSNENATLEIYNIQGSLVLKRELLENKNTIPVSGLYPGMYIIKITRKAKSFSSKLIIYNENNNR